MINQEELVKFMKKHRLLGVAFIGNTFNGIELMASESGNIPFKTIERMTLFMELMCHKYKSTMIKEYEEVNKK